MSTLFCGVFLFTEFSILYIHSFVYTVYDDITGQRTCPGHSGESAAHEHARHTATETASGKHELTTSSERHHVSVEVQEK